ncbi:MAG: tRNA lysidine(34) synthetase TilS [Desulfobulbus sp.]|jgi:tRNA(Ile)-lysidine synthase
MQSNKRELARHPLEERVRRFLLTLPCAVQGRSLLVGVSAGADSLALLHVLAALRAVLDLRLVAVYIDHGLRPLEIPAEWACVRAAGARLEVEVLREQVQVHEFAALGLSPEQAAREARYQALFRLLAEREADFVVVAHTEDDQVEEVLLRLIRGGGRKALSGMRPCSGRVLRPLLGLRKAELLAYLADLGVVHCHDSSNDDPRFLRNRVRNELLPLLESRYDPGVRRAVLKTAANLAEDEDLLESLLDAHWDEVVREEPGTDGDSPAWRLRRAPFRALHPGLRRRLVERLLWRLRARARYEQILAVVRAGCTGRTGSELHLSQGLRVRVERDTLLFCYPAGRGSWRGRLDFP